MVDGGTGFGAVFAEQVGMCLLVTVFLVFILLLAVDVLTLFGRLFVRTYPFEELFFLERARAVRRAVELPLALVGGVVSAENVDAALDAGFDLIAVGRALICEPDFPRRLSLAKAKAVRDTIKAIKASNERPKLIYLTPPSK